MKDREMNTSISTALESRNGRADLSMSDNGLITKHKEWDGFSTQKEISMLVNLFVISLKVEAHISTLTRPNMLVNGKMISNMAKVLKLGQMAHATKAHTSLVKRVVKVFIIGVMVQSSMENGTTTQSVGVELTNGRMEGSTSVIGRTTVWMVMVSILGLMAEVMQVSI